MTMHSDPTDSWHTDDEQTTDITIDLDDEALHVVTDGRSQDSFIASNTTTDMPHR